MVISVFGARYFKLPKTNAIYLVWGVYYPSAQLIQECPVKTYNKIERLSQFAVVSTSEFDQVLY